MRDFTGYIMRGISSYAEKEPMDRPWTTPLTETNPKREKYPLFEEIEPMFIPDGDKIIKTFNNYYLVRRTNAIDSKQ